MEKVSFLKKALIIFGILILIPLVIFSSVFLFYPKPPQVATFTIKIESNTSWYGNIGGTTSSKTIEGFGSGTWTIKSTMAIAVIQKQTEYGYLRVSILKDGKVLDSQSTTAPFGVVSVSAGEPFSK